MSLTNKLSALRYIWQFQNRWQLIICRLFFSRERINIYRYKGLEILADHEAGDAGALRDVFATDMYRRFLPQLQLQGRPVNVFDIGANVGGFSLLLKAENVEFKKLAFVEMNPKTYSRLKFNIERNIDAPMHFISGAVCGSHQTIEMDIGDGNVGDSLLVHRKEGGPVKLQGYTFDEVYRDSFGEEVVDLCKIDIEGAEIEVFTNPGHDLIQNCRLVLMELHGFGRREPALAEMQRLGFTEIDGDGKNDAMDHVHFFRNDRF